MSVLRVPLSAAVMAVLFTSLVGSTPAVGATAAVPLSVNFQSETSATPAGYVADYGQAFDATRGFGWESLSGSPLSMVGNGRERKVLADKRLDTIMQLQAKSGVTTPGRWELVVPNGSYDVTLAVGDPSFTDSHHVVNLEGGTVVDFTPTTTKPQLTTTRTVTVTDGRLTLDAVGGTNTKIAYLDVRAAGTSSPNLQVTSPEDSLELGSRMVFSTVKNQARTGHSVTVKNSGPGPLSVTGVSLSGAQGRDFQLCDGQATAFTVPAGSSAQVCVNYRPQVDAVANGVQVSQGTLTLTSNDPHDPAYEVSLGGLDTPGYEGNYEPSLQAIFDAVGYSVNAGVTNKPQRNSISGSSEPFGDEVLTPYFTTLDPEQQVSLRPVAHYSGRSKDNSTRFGWFGSGTTTGTYLYQFPGGTATGSANDGYGENQLLVPKTTTATLTFKPTGAFGILDQEGVTSDDTLNYGVQRLHDIRSYPARDSDGQVIAGAWLVSIDIGSPIKFSAKNWDYQDYVFLLTNAQPAAASTAPTGGLDSQSLRVFAGDAGGVSGSGFTSAQGVVDSSKISFASNQLQLTTANDSNTSHTNALQLAVNGDSKFRVQSRLMGPFDSIDAGSEQQGIFWGIDRNNYLKAEIDWWVSDNSRHLTVWQETDGVGKTIKTIQLPGGNATSIDLRIDGDPSPGSPYNGPPTANVAYALNGSSTFTIINGTTPLPIPTDWVRSLTYAGVMTSHSGGAQFTTKYASFTATRR